MGLLVFAYRKLALKRQISDMEFRLIGLTQQKQNMEERVGIMQRTLSAGKNLLSMTTSSLMYSANQSIYQQFGNGEVTPEKRIEMQKALDEKQYATSMMNYAANSIFESMSQSQMAPLKATETQIDQEMASLTNQITLKRDELQEITKQEGPASKEDAPHFGSQG